MWELTGEFFSVVLNCSFEEYISRSLARADSHPVVWTRQTPTIRDAFQKGRQIMADQPVIQEIARPDDELGLRDYYG